MFVVFSFVIPFILVWIIFCLCTIYVKVLISCWSFIGWVIGYTYYYYINYYTTCLSYYYNRIVVMVKINASYYWELVSLCLDIWVII